ncbi:hypothetical protein M514_14587 [Trichuris suis]|uniref:Dynein light chain n=1 Tax=Trichuris suis TaxID=68888 RepID=A0A085NUV1_9BILA|nr:hypothetical protein M514_14587 [Trichuris suis]
MHNEMTDDMLKVVVLKAEQVLNDYDDEEKVKKFLDNFDSPAWQVIVGRSFGVDITYDYESFAYFFLGDVAFMVFRKLR